MMEVVISGITCPVKGTVPVSLNFQVNTLQTLKERKGAFSKSVVIPGSPEVDKLFTHIYDINIDIQNSTAVQFAPDFNANIKTPCYVYDGGTPIVIGFCRLMSISCKGQDLTNIEYTVQITGDNADLFTLLDNYLLTDLDLSAFDHTYNAANVTGSWSLPLGAGNGYVYPMIDFGQNNTVTWNLAHFYPAFFAKQYVDTMFATVARQYDSSFLSSSPFDRLVCPFNRERLMLTATQSQNRAVLETISATQTFSINSVNSGTVISPLIYDNEVYDISNQYSGTGINAGKIVIANYGYYSFRMKVTVNYGLNSGSGTPAATVFIIKDTGTQTAIATFNYTSTVGFGVDDEIELFFTAPATANPGDKFWVRIDPYIDDPLGTALGFVDIKADSEFQCIVGNPAIIEGMPITAGSIVPQNIKCSDFLMWICQLFNLMIEPKRDNPNVYDIETASVFYQTDSVDMTDRLDVSSPVVLKPVGSKTGKKFTYRYKSDTDYHNKLYSDTYGQVYGTKSIEVVNDFTTNEQTTEVGFSPTPLVGYAAHDRVLSAIVTGNVNSPTKHNIRLLYYGGLVPTSANWTFVTALSGTTNYGSYPYAGHLDNVAAPTLDLCFGTPQTVYYNTTVYTDGNVYNTFHADFVSELTSPSGKYMEAQFALQTKDISALTFRKLWYVMGALFRLQTISDYDPVTQLLCRVELLKAKRGLQFSPRTIEVWGGSGSESAPTQAINTDVPTAVRNELSGETGGE